MERASPGLIVSLAVESTRRSTSDLRPVGAGPRYSPSAGTLRFRHGGAVVSRRSDALSLMLPSTGGASLTRQPSAHLFAHLLDGDGNADPELYRLINEPHRLGYLCILCNKMATEAHVNSTGHRKKIDATHVVAPESTGGSRRRARSRARGQAKLRTPSPIARNASTSVALNDGGSRHRGVGTRALAGRRVVNVPLELDKNGLYMIWAEHFRQFEEVGEETQRIRRLVQRLNAQGYGDKSDLNRWLVFLEKLERDHDISRNRRNASPRQVSPKADAEATRMDAPRLEAGATHS